MVTKKQGAKIGKRIAELLGLGSTKDGTNQWRYDTTSGTKTTLGLCRCVERIMKEVTDGN